MSLLESLLSYSKSKYSLSLDCYNYEDNPIQNNKLSIVDNNKSVYARILSVDKTRIINKEDNIDNIKRQSKSIDKYVVQWNKHDGQQNLCRCLMKMERILCVKIHKKQYEFWMQLINYRKQMIQQDNKYKDGIDRYKDGIDSLQIAVIKIQKKNEYNILNKYFKKIVNHSNSYKIVRICQILYGKQQKYRKQVLKCLKIFSRYKQKYQLFSASIEIVLRAHTSRQFGHFIQNIKVITPNTSHNTKQSSINNINSKYLTSPITINSALSPIICKQQPIQIQFIQQINICSLNRLIPHPFPSQFIQQSDHTHVFMNIPIQTQPFLIHKTNDETFNSFQDDIVYRKPLEEPFKNCHNHLIRQVIDQKIHMQEYQDFKHQYNSRCRSSFSILDEQRIQKLQRRVFGQNYNHTKKYRQMINRKINRMSQNQGQITCSNKNIKKTKNLWQNYRPASVKKLLNNKDVRNIQNSKSSKKIKQGFQNLTQKKRHSIGSIPSTCINHQGSSIKKTGKVCEVGELQIVKRSRSKNVKPQNHKNNWNICTHIKKNSIF